MFGYHDEKLATSSKLDLKVPDREIERRTIELSKIINKIYDKKELLRKNTNQV